MLNTRGRGSPHYYSLSPQKPKKVGSRIIIFRTPGSKLLSPQSQKTDIYTEQSSLRPLPTEKYRIKNNGTSNQRLHHNQKLVISPLLEMNKFILPVSTSPMLSVIGIKEAARDRDWVFKARESISRDLAELINNSNGIQTETPHCGYRYHLGKGNNMALIKQCFNSRWWWSEDTAKNANVIWLQGRSQAFFENQEPKSVAPTQFDLNSVEKSVKCSALFESDTLEEKHVDISGLGYDLITRSQSYIGFFDRNKVNSAQVRSHNKLEFNNRISDKKELFFSLKNYYSAVGENMFEYMPVTFHIKNGESDPEFQSFSQKYFGESQKKSTWIIKPGENTNRGNGIAICNSLDDIKSELKNNPYPETGDHTYIIQKYIDKPFLVNKRKFDIRLYVLMTSINGVLQCYFYQEGYIRTSCKDYNSKLLDNLFIHLTNDAVQKKSEDYGKFENGNKLSYKDFERYLYNKGSGKSFNNDVLPTIKKIVIDTIKASFCMLDKNKRLHTFEIFGYDFLLDADLKPWLLEINTNPCLELSSTILARIIPAMLENAFKIAIDPIFPEPPHNLKKTQASLFQDLIPENKFELIFHEAVEGKRFLESLSQSALEKFLHESLEA